MSMGSFEAKLNDKIMLQSYLHILQPYVTDVEYFDWQETKL